MKIYLAGGFARIKEIKEYGRLLTEDGHEVTSTWLREKSDPKSDLTDVSPRFCRDHAKLDIRDIEAADSFGLFTVDPLTPTKRGGRHVEFGYALAQGKTLYLIGPYENIFHYLPGIKQFDTFEEFRDAVKGV